MSKKFSSLIGVIFLLVFCSVGCKKANHGGETEKHSYAVAKLKEAANSDFFWVKIHAYEFLLKLGHHSWVDSSFHSFLQKHEKIAEERIGVWRLGAVNASYSKEERNAFIDKVKEAYLDPNGKDRLHAAETLAKLGYSFKNFDRDNVEQDLASGGGMRGYTLWGLSLPVGDEPLPNFDLLISELENDSTVVAETVAYGLTKMNTVFPDTVWNQLYRISKEARLSTKAKGRLKVALFMNSGQDESPRRHSEELRQEIVKLLNSDDAGLRAAACEALVKGGSPQDGLLLDNMMLGQQPLALQNGSDEDSIRVNLDLQSTAAYAALALNRQEAEHLTLLDWVVIAVYLLWMVVIGFFYSNKSKNKEDYLLGGRAMNPIMVGLSLFATLLSTLSYLAYPGEMIKHGPMMFFGLLSYPLAYFIIGKYIIPQFMKLNVTSAYEVLELKLGSAVRDLGTVFFLLLRFLWMSTIVYATVNTALIHIMGFDASLVPWVCLILALVTVMYTTLGGIKAVVLTDAIQSVVMLGAGILTIVIIAIDFGSLTSWFPTQWLPHWQDIVWKIDLNQRMTIGNIFIMVLLWKVCTSGSDQMAVQRYLSTKNIQEAKKTLRVALWSSASIQLILAVLGLAIAAYFLKYPQSLEPGTTVYGNADTLFPRFILIGLPSGVSGLVVAGLLAAAMSSLSSGLNSSASVISEDVLDRHFPKIMKKIDPLKQVQIISLLLGVIISVCSMFVGNVDGNLLDVVIKVVNLVVAPLFVLFFMALYVPSATNGGVFWGGLFSLLVAILIAFFELFHLSALTIMPISLVSGIAMSWVLSLIDRKVFR